MARSSNMRKLRQVLRKRIFSYLYGMKEGEEKRISTRIADDIELLITERNIRIRQLSDKLQKLKKIAEEMK